MAEELSYVVSPEASALSGGRTRRVAAVVPYLSRWFFGEMLEGVESVLSAAGLDLLLYVVGDPAERSRFFQDLPVRRKVDAVLVVGVPIGDAENARLAVMGVGIVAAGGRVAPYPYVSIDDEAAARQAMDHLLYLGHTRIAMIDAIDPDHGEHERSIAGRALGYTTALADAGIALHDELFVRMPWGASEGARAMQRLLSLRNPPTAVLAHSDEVAFGALRTLRRAGVRVPEDVSLIGIDDHPLSEQTDLTTIHQDVRRQGELAGDMVRRILSGEEQPRPVILPTYLVPRGSTAPPAR